MSERKELARRIVRTLDALRDGAEPVGGLSEGERRDVQAMRDRYSDLRGRTSFSEASFVARTEFIAALLREDEGEPAAWLCTHPHMPPLVMLERPTFPSGSSWVADRLFLRAPQPREEPRP